MAAAATATTQPLALATPDQRWSALRLLGLGAPRRGRDLAFIAMLLDRKVDFVCCDNPHATKFTIHILAAVAEHERYMISARTKAALAVARADGKKLGNYKRIAAAKQLATAARAEAVRPNGAIRARCHLSVGSWSIRLTSATSNSLRVLIRS
jgi:DNA invertase Pin-like site-specific DNA recombinase